MIIENLTERCGKPEPGYSVSETNLKLKRVAKGPARLLVESFICSRCIQKMLGKASNQA